MSTATAAALRAAYGSDIKVTLPGTELVISCRKPDLQEQIFRKVLPLPLLKSVLEEAEQLAPGGVATQQSLEAFLANGNTETGDFIDRWVCLAARSPQIVMTEAEASAAVMWIGELPLSAKLEIFGETFTLGEVGRQVAAATFPADAGGAAPGPDRAPVPDAPIDAAPADGSGGSAGL
jgi:hypothetical protein